MNVLLLAENWPPRVGGIERYLEGLLRHLDVPKKIVVAPLQAGVPLDTNQDTGHGDTHITVLRRRFFMPFVWPKWLLLYWYVRRLVRQEHIDMVVCGKALFEGLVGCYLKRSLGVPYVVCTYAMEIETWKRSTSDGKKLRMVLEEADHVVYINEVTKRALLDLGVREEQLEKVQPGVDEHFLGDDTTVRLHTDTSANAMDVLKTYGVTTPYVLSVGRLIARKGFDDVIRAFGMIDQIKHANVQLVIVGDGPEAKHLEQVAQDEMVRPLFLSHIPDHELHDLYTKASMFVMLPKDIEGDIEGFGMVYLEAGAAGLPVIGTMSGGVPEAVVTSESSQNSEDSKYSTGILVAPDAPQEAARAIEYLLEHPAEARQMGERGKKRAREKFAWDTQATVLKNALDSITA